MSNTTNNNTSRSSITATTPSLPNLTNSITNTITNNFNRKLSNYKTYLDKLLIEVPVLNQNSISDEYLFSINEDISRVFVTEKFKERVEYSGLLGFDFSIKIETN